MSTKTQEDRALATKAQDEAARDIAKMISAPDFHVPAQAAERLAAQFVTEARFAELELSGVEGTQVKPDLLFRSHYEAWLAEKLKFYYEKVATGDRYPISRAVLENMSTFDFCDDASLARDLELPDGWRVAS